MRALARVCWLVAIACMACACRGGGSNASKAGKGDWKRQEDFDKPYGGGYIELQGYHQVPLSRVTLPWPDAGAPAASEKTFIDAAVAAVEDSHQRALRGIDRRQECRVLPNMGQSCEWVETTAAEQAEMRKRLEADRDKLLARIRSDRAELFSLVSDLYPWSDEECAPLRTP